MKKRKQRGNSFKSRLILKILNSQRMIKMTLAVIQASNNKMIIQKKKMKTSKLNTMMNYKKRMKATKLHNQIKIIKKTNKK